MREARIVSPVATLTLAADCAHLYTSRGFECYANYTNNLASVASLREALFAALFGWSAHLHGSDRTHAAIS